jgi:hypothetical protein
MGCPDREGKLPLAAEEVDTDFIWFIGRLYAKPQTSKPFFLTAFPCGSRVSISIFLNKIGKR